jgi:hypothetical protein
MEYLSVKIDAKMVMLSNNNGYILYHPLLKISMVASLLMHLILLMQVETLSPVIWKALLDPS